MRRSALLLTVTLAAGLGGAPLPAQQPGVNVTAYDFRLDLPDTGTTIGGAATVAWERRAGYDDTLRLDLVGMAVDSVVAARTGARLGYAYDGRTLAIATRRLGRRDLRVTVGYHGSPSDGLIARTGADGRRSMFGDNWPNRARYWLPTVDHPGDKAAVTWRITAPAAWRVIANGDSIGVTDAPGGRRTWTYREDAPIPTYTMVLGAAEMTVSRHRPANSAGPGAPGAPGAPVAPRAPAAGAPAAGAPAAGAPAAPAAPVPVSVWAYPADSAFADSVPFRYATDIVEAGMRIIGPFPYTRLSHVESSTRYGGMENSTAIFYPAASYARRTLREGTVRHETAHQWFGDAVTEADWHHVWLSEGFASYFDLVFGAALHGDSVLQEGMRRDARSVMESRVVDRPILDTDVTDPNRMLNANSYQKGAWVLHMLRGLVGDSAFFRGIRDYYAAYRDSSVLSLQFQQKMEAAAGRRLNWFFGQWLTQPGYPKLDVVWRADSAGSRVTLEVLQTQPGAWGRYTIPGVPVEFRRLGRAVGRVRFDLMPQTGSQIFTFPVNDLPDQVVVDPDGTLLMTSEVRNQ